MTSYHTFPLRVPHVLFSYVGILTFPRPGAPRIAFIRGDFDFSEASANSQAGSSTHSGVAHRLPIGFEWPGGRVAAP
jgi:hypothetical protein